MRRHMIIRCVVVAIGVVCCGSGPALAQNPHGELTLDIDCSACHRSDTWSPLRSDLAFDHNRQTTFPLMGRHTAAPCASCHADLRFDRPRTSLDDCAACHVDVHEGKMTAECAQCHTTTSFSEVDGVDIHLHTTFPLTGAHLQVLCESCHADARNGAFTLLATECVDCHESDFVVAHGGQGFPTTCSDCHSDDVWDNAAFDHASVSEGFALVGAHAATSCESCHTPGTFEPIFETSDQEDCLACHLSDYAEEHGGSGYPTTCTDCHGNDTWSGAVFDHALAADGFALVGAHDALSCESCHMPGTFEPIFDASGDEDCYACHLADFQDEHTGSGYPTTCLDCHTTATWEGASFDHAAVAEGFALVGAHEALSCESCHAPGTFEPIFDASGDEDCYACHAGDYVDEHAGSGYPTTCLDCHGTSSWSDAVFNHAAASGGFELLGAHEALACESCHVPDTFEPIFEASDDEDCYACHARDYADEHENTGISTTCTQCHSTLSWDELTLDHAAVSGGFALLGAHESLECGSCHQPVTFEPIFVTSGDEDCYACHAAD